MRVTLETSYQFIGRGGVTRYIHHLLDGLAALPDVEVSEVCCAIPNFEFRQPRRALTTFYREFIWTPLISGRSIRRLRPDVVHLTCFPDLPVPENVPSVVTLYDLSHLRFPHAYRPYTRWRMKHLFEKMREADAIISISDFSKWEAVDLLGLDPAKIHTIHLADTPLPVVGKEEKPLVVAEPYFLFVGSLMPRKNLDLLVKTYRLAADRGIKLPTLAVVGVRVTGVVREIDPPSDWKFLGEIDDTELVRLYHGARALIYPSYYEGFGIPILEAMRAGCPVICSAITSLPEAGGTAARYADQTPEAYLEAMIELHEDPEARAERIRLGDQHCETFSWERTARETAEVYRAVKRS